MKSRHKLDESTLCLSKMISVRLSKYKGVWLVREVMVCISKSVLCLGPSDLKSKADLKVWVSLTFLIFENSE